LVQPESTVQFCRKCVKMIKTQSVTKNCESFHIRQTEFLICDMDHTKNTKNTHISKIGFIKKKKKRKKHFFFLQHKFFFFAIFNATTVIIKFIFVWFWIQ